MVLIFFIGACPFVSGLYLCNAGPGCFRLHFVPVPARRAAPELLLSVGPYASLTQMKVIIKYFSILSDHFLTREELTL
ncbi:hypothetical protein ASE55_10490 [Chryseobacterium sp. Leaf201]|nr:hypothetical protein ASE55_10490 [Chryseobacterium sp. Leaf201]